MLNNLHRWLDCITAKSENHNQDCGTCHLLSHTQQGPHSWKEQSPWSTYFEHLWWETSPIISKCVCLHFIIAFQRNVGQFDNDRILLVDLIVDANCNRKLIWIFLSFFNKPVQWFLIYDLCEYVWSMSAYCSQDAVTNCTRWSGISTPLSILHRMQNCYLLWKLTNICGKWLCIRFFSLCVSVLSSFLFCLFVFCCWSSWFKSPVSSVAQNKSDTSDREYFQYC